VVYDRATQVDFLDLMLTEVSLGWSICRSECSKNAAAAGNFARHTFLNGLALLPSRRSCRADPSGCCGLLDEYGPSRKSRI